MGVVREEGARGPWTAQVRPALPAAHLPRALTQPARGAWQHLQGMLPWKAHMPSPLPTGDRRNCPVLYNTQYAHRDKGCWDHGQVHTP